MTAQIVVIYLCKLNNILSPQNSGNGQYLNSNIKISISNFPFYFLLLGKRIPNWSVWISNKNKKMHRKEKSNQKMLLERLCGNNHFAEAKNFVPKFTNEKSSSPSG